MSAKKSTKNAVAKSERPLKTSSTRRSVFNQTAKLMLTSYYTHNIGRSGAGLAYYLMFALFPLLIFISNLLGSLNLNISSIITFLESFLPRDILNIIESYLEHISQNSSSILLGFSLVFSVYFPWRAVKGLMDDVRRAYNLGAPRHPVKYTFRQIIYTVIFLAVIILSLLASTLGKRVLTYLMSLIPELYGLKISDTFITIWNYLRFVLVAVLLFGALASLYAVSQDEKQPKSAIIPGAIAAVIFSVVVSIGFSFYVENFANYSVIYGALGTVVVLLVWLYLTSVILILGAELNSALRTVRMNRTTDGSSPLDICEANIL